MSGEDIKIFLRRYGKTQKALAEMLGESPQNIGSMLEARDVKSSLIERISAAFSIPIGTIYGESSTGIINEAKASGQATAVAGGIMGNDSRLLGLLEEKDRQIARQQNQITKLLEMLDSK